MVSRVGHVSCDGLPAPMDPSSENDRTIRFFIGALVVTFAAPLLFLSASGSRAPAPAPVVVVKRAPDPGAGAPARFPFPHGPLGDAIRQVNAEQAFRQRVREAYEVVKAQGLSITRDKGAVMRQLSGKFPREVMGHVYAAIRRLGA